MLDEIIQMPIDLMLEQPFGWIQASLPLMMIATRSIVELTRGFKDSFSWDETRDLFMEQRWFEITGIEPENTHFTIVVPVHNEEALLPSFLGALFISEVPSKADMQVVFVVNGSSDRSAELIKRRLSQIGLLTKLELSSSLYDERRSHVAHQVLRKKTRFLVIETPSLGKANALNIGNEIAVECFHSIAINIDANNWVEPDAIALLYKKAMATIVNTPELNVAIVNANEFSPTRETQMQASAREKTQSAEVTGWMFAWSTKWIFENNGFLPYAIEDYGAGLLALSQGMRIVESDANIWGYSAGNLFDENREIIRFIYGAMQLAERFKNDPLAMQILLADFPCLRPLTARLKLHFLRRQGRYRPEVVIRNLLKWLFDEFLIFLAHRKLRRDPYGQSWRPIRSTK